MLRSLHLQQKIETTIPRLFLENIAHTMTVSESENESMICGGTVEEMNMQDTITLVLTRTGITIMMTLAQILLTISVQRANTATQVQT